MSLTQTAVTDPYVKDYDALEGAGQQCWPGRFDVSNWALIGACRDGASVGSTVIATRTPGPHMLGGRDDVAVLWDIRVSPRERGGASGRRCSGPPRTGRRPRLPVAQDRDSERQRSGLPLLPEDGLHPGRHRPVRLSQSASRGAAAVVEGPGTARHELHLT